MSNFHQLHTALIDMDQVRSIRPKFIDHGQDYIVITYENGQEDCIDCNDPEKAIRELLAQVSIDRVHGHLPAGSLPLGETLVSNSELPVLLDWAFRHSPQSWKIITDHLFSLKKQVLTPHECSHDCVPKSPAPEIIKNAP